MRKNKLLLIIGLLSFFILVLNQINAVDWQNESYSHRYPFNITFSESHDTINNTLVKLNISGFEGYLPSLKVYDEDGNELKWGWYFQTDFYNDSTDKIHYNQTIMVLSNFTNNTVKTLYVYTPSSFIKYENQTLISFMFDYEGTLHNMNATDSADEGAVSPVNISIQPDNSIDGESVVKIIDNDTDDSAHVKTYSDTIDTPITTMKKICYYMNGIVNTGNINRGYVIIIPNTDYSTYVYHYPTGSQAIRSADPSYQDWGVTLKDGGWNYICQGDFSWGGTHTFSAFFEGEYLGQFNLRTGQHGVLGQFQWRWNNLDLGMYAYMDRTWGTTSSEVENFYKDPEIIPLAEETLCFEDWIANYTQCSVSNNMTLIYYDNSSCGTFDDLPLDNGTVSSCNYCTLSYHLEQTGCVDFRNTTYPVYDNFASCCNLTGLAEDCELPANVSSQCIGIHDITDVTGAVIDLGVEIGIQYIALAGVIVLIMLGGWLLFVI